MNMNEHEFMKAMKVFPAVIAAAAVCATFALARAQGQRPTDQGQRPIDQGQRSAGSQNWTQFRNTPTLTGVAGTSLPASL